MEDWRLIAFVAFLFVIGAAGWLLRQRRRKAQRTGNDPLYAVASLADEAMDRPSSAARKRGTGTTNE